MAIIIVTTGSRYVNTPVSEAGKYLSAQKKKKYAVKEENTDPNKMPMNP